jgi:hypothetical protein
LEDNNTPGEVVAENQEIATKADFSENDERNKVKSQSIMGRGEWASARSDVLASS